MRPPARYAQTGLEAANVGALVFASHVRQLEKSCGERDAAKAVALYRIIRGAHRPLLEASRARAPGERMTDRIAIIADDETSAAWLLAETAAATASRPELRQWRLGARSRPVQGRGHRVLDVDMPGMDGLAVCRRLREEPRFATLTIVMVTGHEDAAAIGGRSKPADGLHLQTRQLGLLPAGSPTSCQRGRRRAIERLAYYTPHGLANRQRCIDTAERLFEATAQTQERWPSSNTDLSSLKRVNDTFVIRSEMPSSRI